MKPVYPQLTPRQTDNSKPKRRFGQLIILADIILIIIIFTYFNNRTENDKLGFGKPAVSTDKAFTYTLYGQYLSDLKIYSFTLTIEKNDTQNSDILNNKEKNNTIKIINRPISLSKNKTEMQLNFSLKFKDQKFFHSNHKVEIAHNQGEVRLWRIDIAATEIQRIMHKHPDWVTPAKKNKLFSFDRDKIIVTAEVSQKDIKIIEKQISLDK